MTAKKQIIEEVMDKFSLNKGDLFYLLTSLGGITNHITDTDGMINIIEKELKGGN